MTKPLHYTLRVTIEPEKGKIAVSGEISLVLSAGQPLISFDIHETFQINRLLINGNPVQYSVEHNESWPIIPASKKVTVKIPRGSPCTMGIQYCGTLKELPEWGTYEGQELALDDQINTRMVELANYSCWYPLFGMGNKFDIDLEVSLPLSWTCVCSGRKVETWQQDRVMTCWTARNDWDIVIVASPQFTCEEMTTAVGTLYIYHTSLPREFIVQEAVTAEEVITLFTSLLGEPESGVSFTHVYSPKKKGQGGLGFGRSGLIVTSEGRILDLLNGNSILFLLHGIAHETAHFWWSFGTGQGDWINETFAEYFSLIAIRELSSVEKFERILKMYEENVRKLPDDAPSLSDVPFSNDEIGYTVRYYKGTLMLDYFRNLLGDPKFFAICREFYQTFHKTVIGTPQFHTFWSERLGNHGDDLEHWLTARGNCLV